MSSPRRPMAGPGRACRAGLALAACLGLSGVAAAQRSPALDRASLSIGGFDARSSTVLHARTTDGSLYGDVHLENDLGFPRRDWTQRLRADFMIDDDQGLSFDFYRYRRAHHAVLDTGILYNGVTYDTHALAEGLLGFDFGSVAYRWWVGRGDDVLGLGIGAGYYRVEASISGQATVTALPGYSVTGYTVTSTNDNAWAPLLQLGWRHALGEHWRLYADASGVKKNGGRLHGHAYRAALGVQWFPAPSWGISADYGIQRIRLWRRHYYYRDSLDLKLDGPSVYATLRF